MSEDLEQRLRSFPDAVVPPQSPSVGDVERGGIRRRRMRRAVAGATAAAVVGVGGLLSFQMIQSDPAGSTRPASSAFQASDDEDPWVRHENQEWGVSVRTPESWHLRWGESKHVAIASFSFGDEGFCDPGGALATLPVDGAFLWMFEAPNGSGWHFDGRPDDLTLDESTFASYEGLGCQDSYRVIFEDKGRFFVAYVAFGHDVSNADRERATEVLDSVEVDPH
jgi:hypothetical protein